jgi:hypothetical protein
MLKHLKSNWLVIVAVASTAALSWHFATGQETKAKTVQQWEYNYGTGYSREHITRMGEEGWELIAVTQTAPSEWPTMYFKRPK